MMHLVGGNYHVALLSIENEAKLHNWKVHNWNDLKHWHIGENAAILMTDFLIISLPQVWRVRLNWLTGPMWSPGRSLPTSGLDEALWTKINKIKLNNSTKRKQIFCWYDLIIVANKSLHNITKIINGESSHGLPSCHQLDGRNQVPLDILIQPVRNCAWAWPAAV